jgi:putative ABC transport system substrate-binding protein
MRTAVAVLLVLAALPTSAPLAAEDQSKRKIPLVGYLTLGAAIPPSVFVSRLRDLGYIDKENVTIEYRFGEGRHDVMGALAGELVSLNVDVIMAVGDEAIAAAKKATTIIPIVMFACDALAVGFINSLSSPGGNITGVTCLTAELSPKRVALLKKIVPTASRVGLMFNPANAGKPKDAERTKAIAQGLGFKIQSEEVLEPADFGGRSPRSSASTPKL